MARSPSTFRRLTNFLGLTEPPKKDDEGKGFVTTVSSDLLAVGRLKDFLKTQFPTEFEDREPVIELAPTKDKYVFVVPKKLTNDQLHEIERARGTQAEGRRRSDEFAEEEQDERQLRWARMHA